MRNKKIYIAGENGLVGSNLVRYFREKFPNVISTNSKTLDLRDKKKVEDFFRNNRPDSVVLVAARHGGIGAYQAKPVKYLEDNVQIFGNVIHCAYEYGVERLINIGASCVYRGGSGQILKEEDYDKNAVQKPTEPYGLAKLYGMKLCEYYNKEKGTNYVSVLPANLYGNGIGYKLDESSVLPSMLRRFEKAKQAGDPLTEIWGDGKAHREFLHVLDLVKAIYMLMEEETLDYSIYNVGSNEMITINELADMVAEIVGYTGEIAHDLSKPNGEDRGMLDCGRIREMGWYPAISLREGVCELYINSLGKIDKL